MQDTTTDYRRLAEERFTFPGAYELFFITDDGGVLCSPCVVTEWDDTISQADEGDGWFIVGVDHSGNCDEPVHCDHCNREVTA